MKISESQVSHPVDVLDNDEDEGGVGGGADEVSVIDVVDNHKLQEIQLTKKEFNVYIKDYLKKVKGKLEETGKTERVPEFMKGATAFVKFLLSKFDELQFYVGENYNTEGSLGYSY